jgi:hypothetical protein
MSQHPRTSLIEAATQATVGIPIGFSVAFAVGLLQLPAAPAAAMITGLMFVASTARGYVIRRRFDREPEP